MNPLDIAGLQLTDQEAIKKLKEVTFYDKAKKMQRPITIFGSKEFGAALNEVIEKSIHSMFIEEIEERINEQYDK